MTRPSRYAPTVYGEAHENSLAQNRGRMTKDMQAMWDRNEYEFNEYMKSMERWEALGFASVPGATLITEETA